MRNGINDEVLDRASGSYNGNEIGNNTESQHSRLKGSEVVIGRRELRHFQAEIGDDEKKLQQLLAAGTDGDVASWEKNEGMGVGIAMPSGYGRTCSNERCFRIQFKYRGSELILQTSSSRSDKVWS